ncbi:MAG: hypothetical protein ACYDA0_03190 [Candidatus Dormibacteraceae bacterium]
MVRVRCTINKDPRLWGYHDLDLPFDGVATAPGFPVLNASVSYAGRGYSAIMGWVQLVRINADPPDHRDVYLLDLPPMFGGMDLPFLSFSPNPELFDAPSMVQRQGKLRWVAHTFLCANPGVVMKPVVSAILGFSWGYDFRGDGKPHLRPPRQLSPTDWNGHLKFLRSRCPGWRFRPGFSPEADSAGGRPAS